MAQFARGAMHALRLLKIIEPYLVEQERMVNATFEVWVEAFGAELLFLLRLFR
jgi:hypothetical protein